MADWACDYSMADDTGSGLTAWANAKKTLKAVTDLAAAGDTIYVDTGTAQVITAATIYSLATGVRVIASNDKTNFPPQTLSTTGVLSSTGVSSDIRFNGIGVIYGISFQLNGSSTTTLVLGSADGSKIRLINCDLVVNIPASSTSSITIGASTTQNSEVVLENTTALFSNAGHRIVPNQSLTIIGGKYPRSGGTLPTTLFVGPLRSGIIDIFGADFSNQTTGTIFGDSVSMPSIVTVRQSKFGGATIAPAISAGSMEITLYDCASTDTHYHIAHYSHTGSTTVSTALYANDGACYNLAGDKCSWVVAGNANANRANPYVSPWIPRYNELTTAIAPEIEILRNGTTTPYTDTEVWGEWLLKTVGGSPLATLYSDFGGHLSAGADQDSGVGLSGWTGESGSAWSGKLVCPSVTPAEIGHISARVVVTGNFSVYVDPRIRGI